MKQLFDSVSLRTAKMVTNAYSTSFSLGIFCLDKRFHDPIYAVYGFVRFADEIVDSFHDYDKQLLLDKFEADTYEALHNRISLNPILNAFQNVVHEYQIDQYLIDTFLKSMRMDLHKEVYSQDQYEEYILGSAEVVGLMCLRVFCENDTQKFDELKDAAMKLGSAFQKINFLRDLHTDYKELGRVYFPGVAMNEWNDTTKAAIEKDIDIDFAAGFEGIKKLPSGSQFGVYIAYVYYYALFQKIKGLPAKNILKERVRIPNKKKYGLLIGSYFKHSFNML
ncbi:MAG: phytoene/squalene synthase family protein [Schleiferiaceae bacterium]|nr:phytoene/squalene synthase family protein [Schleiferiaceae bacterium]